MSSRDEIVTTEARALLDEQVKALRQLGDAAEWAYWGVSSFPAFTRTSNEGDFGPLSDLLASLVTRDRRILSKRWEKAKHLLGPSNPVYVPLPVASRLCPSACEGASLLLFELAILTSTHAKSACLPSNREKLRKDLEATFREGGYPMWTRAGPHEALRKLADAVREEIQAAIERLTHRRIGTVESEIPAKESAPLTPHPESEIPETETPTATEMDDLRKHSQSMRGFGRKVIEAICEGGGELQLTDIATICEWQKPYDDSWYSLRRRVNESIREHLRLKLVTHDKRARIVRDKDTGIRVQEEVTDQTRTTKGKKSKKRR